MDTDPLRDEHAELTERKATLAGLVADGTMTGAEVRESAERLNARLAELDRLLAGADGPAVMLTEEEMAAGVAALERDRQRVLIDTLMDVYLLRVPQGKRGFDPATVRVEWKG